jgi:hypothetical protein
VSLPDKSDPDGTDTGRSKGARVLPEYFLMGIRERQIKIFKALNFKKNWFIRCEQSKTIYSLAQTTAT